IPSEDLCVFRFILELSGCPEGTVLFCVGVG
ncbi:hypothetical protein EVA_10510, partial [gut metagenome]